MDRYVWEGWTVGAFIRELAPQVEMIMSGQSWREPFRNKQELADWCRDNQPYYNCRYLQPIITQYFIDNKSEIWLLFLIAHSKR